MTYLPSLSSSFVIRNIANKDIRIFGTYTLKSGREADLFKVVPNLTESRLLEDLTSGDLDLEINGKGSLVVESHNLTSLRALMNQGREDYRNPDGPVTIYVRTTGNDIDGDGSATKPYRQLRRALRDIPADAKDGSKFWIQMGPGDFELCTLPPKNPNIFVGIRGDIDNPVASWAFTAANPVDGFAGRLSLPSGEYDAEIGNGTHWLYRHISDSINLGYVVLESTSPNVIIAEDFFNSGTLSVHEFTTKFTTPANFILDGTTPPHTLGYNYGYGFHGVRFDTASFYPRNLSLRGCRVVHSSPVTFGGGATAAFFSGTGNIGFAPNNNLPFPTTDSISGSYFSGDVSLYGSLRTKACTYAGRIQLRRDGGGPAKVTMKNIDFITSALECFNTDGAGSEVIISLGNVNVNPERVRIWNGPLNFRRNTSHGFVGSTTGIPFTLTDGAQCIALKAACDGTLSNSTNAGQDIVVGGNAVVAFADLPTTDAAAGSPQFCRAT